MTIALRTGGIGRYREAIARRAKPGSSCATDAQPGRCSSPRGAARLPSTWQSGRPTNERSRGQSSRRVRGCRPRSAVQSHARAGTNRTTVEPLRRLSGCWPGRKALNTAAVRRMRPERHGSGKFAFQRRRSENWPIAIEPALPSANWRRSTASRPARCRTPCVVTGRRVAGQQSQWWLTPHPGRCVVSPGAHFDAAVDERV